MFVSLVQYYLNYFSQYISIMFQKGDSCQQDQSKVRKRIKLVGQNQSVLKYTNQKTKIQGVAGIILEVNIIIIFLLFKSNRFFQISPTKIEI